MGVRTEKYVAAAKVALPLGWPKIDLGAERIQAAQGNGEPHRVPPVDRLNDFGGMLPPLLFLTARSRLLLCRADLPHFAPRLVPSVACVCVCVCVGGGGDMRRDPTHKGPLEKGMPFTVRTCLD